MRVINPQHIRYYDNLKQSLGAVGKEGSPKKGVSFNPGLPKVSSLPLKHLGKMLWVVGVMASAGAAYLVYHRENKTSWKVGLSISEETNALSRKWQLRKWMSYFSEDTKSIDIVNGFMDDLRILQKRAWNLPSTQDQEVLCIKRSCGKKFLFLSFNVVEKVKTITAHGRIVETQYRSKLEVFGIRMFTKKSKRAIKRLQLLRLQQPLDLVSQLVSLLPSNQDEIPPEIADIYIREAKQLQYSLEGAFADKQTD